MVIDTPHVVQINEDTVSAFGDEFSVTPHSTMDTSVYSIQYSITRWPGNAPTDCSVGRSKVGLVSAPSNNWLSMSSTSPLANKPSLYTSKLATDTGLDAESCTLDYAAQVTASLTKSGNSVGSVSCYVNIIVGNVNESPSILTNSISNHAVDETSLPGSAIGSPLQASDAEVNAGLQQLTWKIMTCYPFEFKRDGTGDYSTVDMMPNCHIKISSCSGQLAVASMLNYETYTKYKLEIQGKFKA